MSYIYRAILSLFLLTAVGCYQCNYYRYKPCSIGVLDGTARISLRGTSKSYEKDGDEYMDYTSPYHLFISYHVNPTNKLYKLEVNELVLRGKDSGKSVSFNAESNKKVWDSDPVDDGIADKFISIGFLIPEDVGLKYEDYEVEAKLRVYKNKDSKPLEAKIKATLETDFKKSKRSSLFDNMMSV